jgi:cytochrome c biogenesis factor
MLPEAPGTPKKEETLVVEASVKPMINLVWTGTVTLVIGFFLTILRRVQEARL